MTEYLPPSKTIEGPVVWEDSENGHHWQLEQLAVPRRIGNSERPYRLWCNGQPAFGGQWQYSIEGAKWEARRRTDFDLHSQVARSLVRIAILERQLYEATK